jgi:hypothetical protein
MIGSGFFEMRPIFRFGVPTAIIGICAAILGWNAGETVLPPSQTTATTPWSLPPPDNRGDLAQDLSVLNQRLPWSPGLLGAASGAQAGQPAHGAAPASSSAVGRPTH